MRATVTWLGLLSIAIGFGALIFFEASNDATRGGFPLWNTGLLFLLVWVWWSPPKLFRSSSDQPLSTVELIPASHKTGGALQPPTRNGDSWRERLIWLVVSSISWGLLGWIAERGARTAFRNPVAQQLVSYREQAFAFIIFLYLWIVVFPVLDLRAVQVEKTNVQPLRVSSVARIAILTLSLLVGVYGLWGTGMLFRGHEVLGAQGFWDMQQWFVRMVLIVYVMVLARFAFPRPNLLGRAEY